MANKLVPNLSGGINAKTGPVILKDNECELIVNYNLDIVGTLTRRNGYDSFVGQSVDGKRVHGLFQYTNTATTAETTQVLVVNNSGNTQSVIYYNNSGTWATSKTNDTAVSTFTNFNRARFATFLDTLFRVNGQDVVATSTDVNGGTWGTTNAPGSVLPAFISVFTDRVYIANDQRSGANHHGSRVYFSSLPNAGATTITWNTTNDTFDVNPDDGDEITALENNGNRLLIFKNRALYRWEFGQVEPDRLIGVGTESQECVKTNFDLGITFFANKKGVYAYTGARPKFISRKMQKWFTAVTAADVNDFTAEVDEDHYYLYIGDSVTVDTIVHTNVMLVYTISLDAWVVYTTDSPIRHMARLIQSNEERIYFGNNDGRTYQWDIGLTDDSGPAGQGVANVEIPGEVITKEYLLTYPMTTMLDYVETIGNDTIGTLLARRLDRSGDFIPFKFQKNRFNVNRLGKSCNSVQLRFTDSTNAASRIEGFNFEHLPSDKRE